MLDDILNNTLPTLGASITDTVESLRAKVEQLEAGNAAAEDFEPMFNKLDALGAGLSALTAQVEAADITPDSIITSGAEAAGIDVAPSEVTGSAEPVGGSEASASGTVSGEAQPSTSQPTGEVAPGTSAAGTGVETGGEGEADSKNQPL
jgi:hypothetical protein